MSRTIKYLLIAVVVIALGVCAYLFFMADEEPDMTVPQIELTDTDTTAVQTDTTEIVKMDLSEFSSVGDEEE
ncbi:MAG: hypothetical protein K2H74_06980 [Paramuribaculum sp.]|nr:hypothetical protein [Paramuribaculum sp.]